MSGGNRPNFACPDLRCAIASVTPQPFGDAVTPVSNPSRFSSRFWLIVPLLALGFVVWSDLRRVRRVEHTTSLVEEPPLRDANSPTGYAGGARRLIVPEHNNDSYHWIVQTQLARARGATRLRHVDYDNAPFGRPVGTPSPYRWWLGLVAWLGQTFAGESPGAAVEWAALWADPVWHLLLLTGTTVFVLWQFGLFPAALFSAGLAALFPLAGEFIPGAPDDRGLSLAFTLWSVLPLLVGIHTGQGGDEAAARRARRWFFIAGVTGGIGLWVSVSAQVPVLVGLGLGGLTAALVTRRQVAPDRARSPWAAAWLAWTFGGAATVLAACLIEYFPDHLGSWQLRVIHPLYGVAWLGLGELLVLAVGRIQGKIAGGRWRVWLVLLGALAAVTALPLAMRLEKNEGFLAITVTSSRLTKLPGSAVATNLWTWLLREGLSAHAWTVLLPALLVLPAGWLLARRSTPLVTRMAVAVALGPVLIALGFAGWHLRGWSLLDGLLLALLIACTAAVAGAKLSALNRGLWTAAVGGVLALGVVALMPLGKAQPLNQAEVVGLIERDLARWLARHVGPGGALVLAPPNETTTLYYYGGLRGLGTLAWENQDGVGAAIRIVSASTPEEAKELVDRRGVTHFIIPSWDAYLDEYARIGMGQLDGTFMSRLHQWRLPPWLRPVAFQLPTIAGFEGETVRILQVVEDQDDAVALSRTAEYFLEMGQPDLAASVAQALRRFPADLGSLVARAQVEFARDETASFGRTVELLRSRLTANGDRSLPWDRRTSLAIVLAHAKQMDLAREQVQRCLAEVDEPRLRALDTGALYRLQVLGKAFGLAIADPRLHALALELLPVDMRSRL